MDKVCVVAGAASPIGRAVAERFAREGGLVVGIDLVGHDVGVLPLEADLTDEGRVRAVFDEIVERFGRIDVLYNNAGLMDRNDGSALDCDLETWRRVLDANITPALLTCKHGIRRMLDADPATGSVINSASFLAHTGAATAPMAFSASKSAIVQLSRDLGIHLARSGVRVNAVLFGPIETPAQRAILGAYPDTLPARLIHWPMGRFGTLEEAAGAIAFLASDDAGFITAAALPVDGGITTAFTIPS
ncbi:MAG TPA: SDR family oxidoreductase [Acidimicrobiales bacterium]|nr:SDR family oxidoreductase [Acidimicrobiales bacterium]